ncbi:MAG: hypothetical protein M3409_11855 [Gemmatimonadota bacterium]|nr:hypothetical protein [Gemmatimonadota bacterium]
MPGDRDPVTPGTAEVHTRVTGATGGGMAGATGASSLGGTREASTIEKAEGAVDQAKDRAKGAADQVRDKAHDAADQVKGRAQELRGRAGEVTSQAQERASEALHRAEQALEDSGALRYVRDNPLPVLGVAFGLGYLLAGSSDTGGSFGKAKHQIRGAIMGGLSAAVATEARSMLGMQGQGGGGGGLSSMLQNVMGGGSSSSRQGQSGAADGSVHRQPSHQEMR